MAVDPSLAFAYKGIEVPNQLAQYAQLSQLQGMQQANELNALKMQEMRALNEERNALRQLNPSSADYESQLFKVNPQLGIQYRKEQAAAAASAATAEKTKAETAIKRTELFKNDLVNVNTPQDAAGWLQSQYQDPVLGSVVSRVPLEKALAQIPQDPQGFAQWKQKNALGMDKYIERTTLTEAEKQRIAQEGQRIGLEGRRVAVMEDENRRAKDPAFQQAMAAAKATGEALAKGNVAAQQALPGVISNAQDAVNLIDQMVGKQEVRDKSGKVIQPGTPAHPGFENAVGTTWKPGFRFIPGTDAADFQSLFDQVKGAAFLEAFNVLKGAGAISEKEGEKATAARTRMSTAQSEKEFVSAAREYQDVIRRGVEVMQKKAGGTAPMVPAAAGGIKFLGFE